MRALVFSVLFLTIAASAQAVEPPSATSGCLAPGACFVVNTGPCGSVMVNNTTSGGVTPMSSNDPALPAGVQGMCGIYAPPYWSGVPRQQVPQEHCDANGCVVTSGGSR